jgi:hypothetical protein
MTRHSTSHPSANGSQLRLSPGPENIHDWIKTQTLTSLAMYNVFPAFPTSFIVASDCEIVVRIVTNSLESGN